MFKTTRHPPLLEYTIWRWIMCVIRVSWWGEWRNCSEQTELWRNIAFTHVIWRQRLCLIRRICCNHTRYAQQHIQNTIQQFQVLFLTNAWFPTKALFKTRWSPLLDTSRYERWVTFSYPWQCKTLLRYAASFFSGHKPDFFKWPKKIKSIRS